MNALALSGRVEGAETFFHAVTDRIDDLGLSSEERDPETGAFLRNLRRRSTTSDS